MKALRYAFTCLTALVLLGSTGSLWGKVLDSKQDSLDFVTIRGQITDSETGDPVAFATILVQEDRKGTVSNIEGGFILKIPAKYPDPVIEFSHLSYKRLSLKLSQLLMDQPNEIIMEPSPLMIREITVRPSEPEEILQQALLRIRDNYSVEPVGMTAFYREAVRQNRKYVSVSEALVDIYKSDYFPDYEGDRVRIFKGKRSQDVEKMDTLIVKLQGGPKINLLLDVVKHPDDLFVEDMRKLYNYYLDDIIIVDERPTYVIGFDQKPRVEFPLFKGKAYIDVETLAIKEVDFEISPHGLPYAAQYLVKKKPLFVNVDPTGAQYFVKYIVEDGKWYLNYLRSEAQFRIRWKKRLFNTRVYIMSEMAITSIDTADVEKFRARESLRGSDIFAEEVIDYEDPDFWGEYNYIKPEESIEKAMERIRDKILERSE